MYQLSGWEECRASADRRHRKLTRRDLHLYLITQTSFALTLLPSPFPFKTNFVDWLSNSDCRDSWLTDRLTFWRNLSRGTEGISRNEGGAVCSASFPFDWHLSGYVLTKCMSRVSLEILPEITSTSQPSSAEHVTPWISTSHLWCPRIRPSVCLRFILLTTTMPRSKDHWSQ